TPSTASWPTIAPATTRPPARTAGRRCWPGSPPTASRPTRNSRRRSPQGAEEGLVRRLVVGGRGGGFRRRNLRRNHHRRLARLGALDGRRRTRRPVDGLVVGFVGLVRGLHRRGRGLDALLGQRRRLGGVDRRRARTAPA